MLACPLIKDLTFCNLQITAFIRQETASSVRQHYRHCAGNVAMFKLFDCGFPRTCARCLCSKCYHLYFCTGIVYFYTYRIHTYLCYLREMFVDSCISREKKLLHIWNFDKAYFVTHQLMILTPPYMCMLSLQIWLSSKQQKTDISLCVKIIYIMYITLYCCILYTSTSIVIIYFAQSRAKHILFRFQF